MSGRVLKKQAFIFVVFIAVSIFFLTSGIEATERSLPPEQVYILASSAPGYCPSYGGSHLYEYISEVKYERKPGGTLSITVDIYIANPTGCTAGQPCPEYDNSPEYINVWVDWNGDKVFDSGEKVIDIALTGYLGINYRGTMTTSDIITIPSDAVPVTWMRTNLGWGHDPNDPCELNWTWGDIVDKEVHLGPIKVIQLDASNDIDIQNITDPVWKKMFDSDGNLVDVTPIEDDPIADFFMSGSFKVDATLDAFPTKPPWTPAVDYTWTFPTALPAASGNGSFSGWTGSFDVVAPQKVGIYDLQLQFIFKDDQNNVVGDQSISRKVYITYDTPILSPPKEEWLEKSTTWANTAADPSEVTSILNQGIYSGGGWLYRDSATSWQSLVEGTASSGNCVSFSNVWNNLCKVLGVTGTSTVQTNGMHGAGFVTKPATALPPESLKGNAHPQSGSVDRWVFGMHQVGNNGGYFDPTFGDEYGGIYDFIEWHMTGATGVDAFGFYYAANGHKVYPRSASPPWGDYEYHSPVQPESPKQAGNASFSGSYSEQGIDVEGDGVYNFLGIEAEVDIVIEGEYSVFGVLKSGDTLITTRSSVDSMGLSSDFLSGGPGTVTASLTFSGEDIYGKGIDGIYTAHLWLFDKNGLLLDSKTFDTTFYYSNQFGEFPARITGVADYGEDLDSNGLYDYLTAEVSLHVINPMDYGVEGVLYWQDEPITYAYVTEGLDQGNREVRLHFSGQKIRSSQKNGPYRLIVNLYDKNTHQIGKKEAETSAYQYTAFEEAVASFSGSYSDNGRDTDGDGLYNNLRVEVGVDAVEEGDYGVVGWLSDSQGNDIAWASSKAFLSTGSGMMSLDFSGMKIYKHGIDGPYLLRYVVLKDASDILVDSQSNAYTTSFYKFTDFQKPEEPLIALTGNYTDYGTDTDGDGVLDYLTVEVEVILSKPGYAVLKARLMDLDEKEIVWADNTVHLEAGQPRIIHLRFDGDAIYDHGADGPYYLRDVYLYHTGDPLQPDYVYEAYTTGPYSYWQFGENAPPVADAGGPYEGYEGTPVTFDGSYSYDPNDSIVKWEWDLDCDGQYDDASGEMVTFTWGDDYSGCVGLRVTDSFGLTAVDETEVTVYNVAPAIEALTDRTIECCADEVLLNIAFSDPGWMDIHTAEIDWGDGMVEPGAVTEENEEPDATGTIGGSHAYCALGEYTLTLRLTDDDGAAAEDSFIVSVVDTTPPVVYAELIPIHVEEDEGLFEVRFHATDICDPDPKVSARIYCGTRSRKVKNGQRVSIESDDECEFEYEDGILEIEGARVVLKVTAKDASENIGNATAKPEFPPEEDDEEDEEDDD